MENKNRFQRFEELLPGGFFVYKANGMEQLLHANQKCIELFQCKDFEEFRTLIGNSFRGIVHPVDYKRVERSIWRQVDNNEEKNDHVIYRITTKEGNIRWVDDFGRLIEDEEFGPIFVVSLYDITDRMQVSGLPCSVDIPLNTYLSKTVGKRKIEDADVQILLDAAREALDAEHIYLLEGLPKNDGFEVIFESKKEYVESIWGIRRVVGEERFRRNHVCYGEDGVVSYWTTLTKKRGAILCYGMFHNDVYDGSIGIVNYTKDSLEWSEDEKASVQKLGRALHQALLFSRLKKIEEERIIQQEKLEVALKAKTTFLSNMSHDIRTPMNAIIGFTRMAKENQAEQEKVLDYLNKIQSASEHMLRIINDVLDVVKIESGKMELNMCPMDLEEECLVTADMFRESMADKSIDFRMDVEVIERFIIGDPVRIRQILVNLIGNALKYTHSGGKVFVNVKQIGITDEGLGDYLISVKDTGIGMSKEYQEHLFKAFERERSATVSGVQGTGLGLAICKDLVDLMGGTITCESETGVGTEFVVTFSAKVEDCFEKETKQDPKDISFNGKRILLVEDNELNREIARAILEEKEILVEEAEDGAVAVAKMKKVAPDYYDLILMDVQMPYMNGYDATREIRKIEKNIPIIAMTADAFQEDRQKALEAGMDGHLSKPIDLDKLFEILQKML